MFILVSERPDSNGAVSLRPDLLHTAIQESMTVLGVLLVLGGSYQCHWESGNEEKWENIFFRGKKGWSYFSFAGQTDQYLLFSKSLSIFWKKCFCFKTQRISCEPNKLYLISLSHVFHIKYWNKKLVPLGHLLQYSEFIIAKSLVSFRRERLFFHWKQTPKTFLSSHSRKWWGKFNEEPWREEPWELHCCVAALWDLVDGEEASRMR